MALARDAFGARSLRSMRFIAAWPGDRQRRLRPADAALVAEALGGGWGWVETWPCVNHGGGGGNLGWVEVGALRGLLQLPKVELGYLHPPQLGSRWFLVVILVKVKLEKNRRCLHRCRRLENRKQYNLEKSGTCHVLVDVHGEGVI